MQTDSVAHAHGLRDHDRCSSSSTSSTPPSAALIGVTVMIWIGHHDRVEAAFLLVDWNVMAILVGIWIMAGYFGKDRRAKLAVACNQ